MHKGNHDHKTIEGKLTIAQIAEDICRLYGQATSPVVIRVPARATAINSLLGFSALFDMLRAHVAEREFFLSHQVKWHGQGADVIARNSSFWTDVKDMSENVGQWFGMKADFYDISFNVLGVDNGIVFEVSRMNHNITLWKRWTDRIKGSNCDVAYEFGDNAMPSEQNPVFPSGVSDPRPQSRGGDGSGFNTGPRPSTHPSSSAGASGSGAQERQQQSQSEPRGPKKSVRSNLSQKNPPTPVMFSEDSLSADEDEQLVTSTNEWTYPNVELAGRKMKAFKRKHFEKGDREVVIILCIGQGTAEDPCGAYDESLIPTSNASSLVNEWEILLRRTTVYLAAWAEGIISPKVLRKYISKGNPEWVRLYRYIWLKSQANHLVVFPSPKTFALATCTGHTADEGIRRDVINNTKLPPAKTSSSYEFLMVKGEMTIVISDLPLNWVSATSKNVNDIQSAAQNWGWNSIQQYAPNDYDIGVNYLEQPCTSVASLIERADPKDDIRSATIHIWISMTDIINYANVRGGGVSFSVKDSSTEISSYFMSCLQKLSDAGKAKNPIVININANGEFLKCHDTTKFSRVTKDIVNELRGEGYLVSWGGPLWRALFPFLDAHGRIKAKGWGEKVIAVAVMEKQLYREKTLLKCMISPQRVNELDHKAATSGIANNEGLIDEPPDEYRYENVNAIPLDPSSRLGRGGRKVRAKMHVPNWDNQPKASYRPSVVQDDKFFWILVYRGERDENEDDPMVSLSGLCDSCAIHAQLDRSDFPNHKECPLLRQLHTEVVW